ncbi:hypothetical protein F4V43_13670 [Paenibacillus spiritus]|uniref:Uncharacterized protein n=1 Tax=Paenibacillus spiritus TaxID=2496557 RepID=A0A5J5G5D9_9BACL|nr:hypothetical protein [Paenibacillus spiritus]KAA9002103.1 hypothetical protein F4V43_13670 [Paenibacillus spiritus]
MHTVLLLLSLVFPFFQTPDSAMGTEPPREVRNIAAPVYSLLTAGSADPYLSSFDSLAGAALFSSREELLQAKGDPVSITPDPIAGGEAYRYADATVGVEGGLVVYVHVEPQQAREYGLVINGRTIDPLASDLRSILGRVDYAAEDGDVYMRGTAALKIYRNPSSGAWEGIDLFDEFSS